MDYSPLYERLAEGPIAPWLDGLPKQVQDAFDPARHGDLPRWLEAFHRIPEPAASCLELDNPIVRAGCKGEISEGVRQALDETLKVFCPWRKGPFELYGVHIDTEWRSDWKWDRLKGAIEPLAGKWVLDVGCGSGYHAWRMRGAGAELVIGIEPYLLYVLQHHVVRRVVGDQPVFVLPLGIDDLPADLTGFDTVFSMGVLYHRRSPLDHLLQLKSLLRPSGELVLETLVIEGKEGEALVPEDRYARMRNVWFLPSPATLIGWMKRCGYRDVDLIDVTPTTIEEQRSTPWMPFESLAECLDASRPGFTIEGYPAPVRAIVLAKR